MYERSKAIIIPFLLSFLLTISLVMSVASVQAADIILWEYYNTGDDTDIDVYGVNWSAQTFTVGNLSHSVTSLRLKVNRIGLPSAVTVSMRATDDGSPSGSDLTSIAYDGDLIGNTSSWYDFDVPNIRLTQGTQYAIVLRVPFGDTDNRIEWEYDSNSVNYPDKKKYTSTNAGTSWAIDNGAEYMFEVWGENLVDVVTASAFTGFIETGDWLITAEYINTYYHPSPWANPQRYFLIRFLDTDGNTTIAQTVCRSWGNRPASVYLAADQITALTYGGNYTVQIYGDFANYPSDGYTLQEADWQGSDLNKLDDWVRLAAGSIGEYYGETYTTFITGTGLALTEDAGGWFDAGIPRLISVRPHLFSAVVQDMTIPNKNFSYGYKDTAWESKVGAQVAADADLAGAVFNIRGDEFLNYLVIAVFLSLAMFAAAKGYVIWGMIACFPILLAATDWRVFDITAIAVGLSILTLLMVRTWVWR